MLYKNEKTKNISFPIGGIGTGSIGLAGNGALKDFEIFNRPNKNSYNGYTHFALRVKDGEKVVTKVLQGDTCENLTGSGDDMWSGFGFGPRSATMAGYPHFRFVTFEGNFPIATLSFSDENFPIAARLTAFNPLIPHDDFHSSLPVAFFEWELENIGEGEVECALAFSVQNPAESSMNEELTENGCRGIFFKDAAKASDALGYCDLCALTDHPDAVAQAFWYRGGWQDGPTMYWKNLSSEARIPKREYVDAGKMDHGTLVAYARIAPGKTEKIRFVLAWSMPLQYNYRKEHKDENGNHITWKNYYATQFENSKKSAAYALERFDGLLQKTRLFSSTLQNNTLPATAIDAISSTLSVLKSPTVLRLEDGSLWGWEGCHAKAGSCEGSCQHVWNYAYALPFLFPKLERSLRENTMRYAMKESGETAFRFRLPHGSNSFNFRACVDGQMGEVIKCYREWKISGDDEWIRSWADKIFKMIEFAWSEENPDRWDADRDGILEGRQHHTLDMELFGTSSWLEGFYLLALRLGAEIADFVGETARAEEYRRLYGNGKAFMNDRLFNGEYFCQRVDLTDKTILEAFGAEEYWNEEAGQIKYQVAEGCIIDQMLADYHAAVIGVNGVFDADKKKKALESLYRYNFKPSMREVTNMWRNFAVEDESGTVICSYPETVSTPAIPIPYCEECMTGFEYALAALMLANGFKAESETMVKAVRDRYDGEKRNPWNEIECGSNYARSMAAFALLPLYSGFSFDMTKKHIGFSPISADGGEYLFSIGNTWGRAHITNNKHTIAVYGSPLTLASYGIGEGRAARAVRADGEEISFRVEGGKLILDPIIIEKTLEIELV